MRDGRKVPNAQMFLKLKDILKEEFIERLNIVLLFVEKFNVTMKYVQWSGVTFGDVWYLLCKFGNDVSEMKMDIEFEKNWKDHCIEGINMINFSYQRQTW